MPDVYSVHQIRDALIPVFKSHGVRKAILFGSYGKGTANDKSDIDLLVDSGLRGLQFYGLLFDVQQVLNKEIDLLDITSVEEGSLIEREIRNTGVILYEE